MKKILLLLVIFCELSALNAQIEFSPGIKAGLNVASVANAGNSAKLDFYVGGKLGVKFSEFYQIQPEIIYSRQGYKGQNEADLNISYLSFGINNKFYPFADLPLHGFIGPAFEFKVSDNFESDNGDYIEGLDISFFGGVGYDISNDLSIEAAFKMGVIDIYGPDFLLPSGSKVNSVFRLGLTYSFAPF